MGRRSIGMPFARVALMGVGVVGLGAGVLTGCQAEETPPAGPSPSASVTASSASPSASASVSPSPSASGEVPAAAREKTEKGAEAFVRYFFDQVNVAWTTPRVGTIDRLSVPECEFCAKTERTAAFLVAEGQRYEKPPVTVNALDVFAGAPSGQHYLAIDLTQNRSRILDASGLEVASDPKKVTQFNVAVKWTDAGWRILGVENAT